MMRTSRRLALTLGSGLAVLGISAAAWAYWSAPVASGSYGVAQAASVHQGSTPSATRAAQAVTVDWAATTLTNGHPVQGYLVARYDAATGEAQTIGANCAGVVTATSCVENAVPSGSWKYAVTPVLANWHGAESVRSGTVSTTPSTLTLARSVYGGTFPQNTTGTLTGFHANETITYRLDGVTLLAGTPSTVDANGNATITSLTIPDVAEGPHTVSVTGDGVPPSGASVGILVDRSAPVVSAQLSPAANAAGWNTTAPVLVTLTAEDGSGAGVDQFRYTTDGSDPKTSGTALSYSSPLSISVSTTVRFYASDLATNVSSVVTRQVNIDPVAPTNGLALSGVTGNAVKSGDTVYYRGSAAGSFTLTNTLTDSGGSGPASSGTAALAGTATGWTHTSSLTTTPPGGPYVSAAFSWSAGTTSAPNVTVTGRDLAGNATGTVLTFVNESAGPTGGSVEAAGLVGTGARYSTSTTLSIVFAAGSSPSGLAAGAQLQRATATLTSGVCGSYGSYTQVGATGPTSPISDTVADQACYRYHYVVSDTLGNATTYTSGDVKVDTTGPTAPSLSLSALTNTYASGGTVYYRSGATSGGFTTTASATDAGAGIASYAFGSAGAGWTSTPAGTGVNSYAWTAPDPTTANPTVTATNNAGVASAGTALTLIADATAPAGGNVSYPNGAATSSTITVTFAAGTDGGSGLDNGTAVLERATAALSAGACGTFSSFATIAANPVSPYVDASATNQHCYRYQYLISDRVGNQATYTSASVTKFAYDGTVSTTPGVVGHWRMDDNGGVDTFTGGSGSNLLTHTGDIGGTWSKFAGGTDDAIITDANRIRRGATGDMFYYSSAVPTSANYAVEADFVVKSLLPNSWMKVIGRQDVTSANGNYYLLEYDVSANAWCLGKRVATVQTPMVCFVQTLTVGQSYRARLDMNGSTIQMFIDGVSRGSVSDSAIAGPGRGGIGGYSLTAASNTTGIHLDNFAMVQKLIDSAGANNGTYVTGPTGAAGALYNDGSTAVRFNGTSSYGTVPDAAALDLGDGPVSIEAWVKRADNGTGTQTVLQKGTGAYQLAFKNNKIGLYRYGTAAAIAESSTTQLDTTAFHHYVVTKSGAVTKIYVDGVDMTVAGTNQTLVNTATPLIMAGSAGEWLNGTLDEVAIYNQVLTPSIVGRHFLLGSGPDTSGPSGGFVDALGLTGVGGRYSASTTLSIGFDPGSDPSGLAASGAQLLRASASLTNGVCGSYGAYQLIATDPSSPRSDTVQGGCWRYRYVVADTLGQATTYTSGDIKVEYSAVIGAGAVGQWRLGEPASQQILDTFVEPNGTLLQNHTASGVTWAKTGVSPLDGTVVNSGGNTRVRRTVAGGGTYYASSYPPATADYSVSADVVVRSVLGLDAVGVQGRTLVSGSLDTNYTARLSSSSLGVTSWELFCSVNNVATLLGTTAATVSVGGSYTIKLSMIGSRISMYVDGVQKFSVVDSDVTAAGMAGIRLGGSNATSVPTDTTGMHLDNFRVEPAAVDSKGTNPGLYNNAVTLGVAGALPSDANTAAQFDGINDTVEIPAAAAINVADTFSFETWAKRADTATGTQTIASKGTNGFRVAFVNGKLGLYNNTNATRIAEVTSLTPTDTTTFHHYVVTKSGATTKIYVDGVDAPLTAGTNVTLSATTPLSLYLASKSGTSEFFHGTLDEAALYNVALSAAAVTEHYGLRQGVDTSGPSGGSVDANGLVGTGGRYSTATSLSIALSPGSDPSGMATSGRRLFRATASLTGGVCGTFGTFTQVGADDPASPYSDTVADQACYRYQYVVADLLGNPTTYASGDVKVDGTAPTGGSVTYAAGYQSGSTMIVSFTSGTDGGSGLDTAAGLLQRAAATLTAGACGTFSGFTTVAGGVNPTSPFTDTSAVSGNCYQYRYLASNNATGQATYASPNTAMFSVVSITDPGAQSSDATVADSLQLVASTATGGTLGYGATGLPAGLTLNAASGLISGTPTTVSSQTVVVTVTDSAGPSSSVSFGWTVVAPVSYATTVHDTASLVSQWRMDEASVTDSFTGTAGSTLQAHSADTGATWAKWTGQGNQDAVLTDAGRLRKGGTTGGAAHYYSTYLPTSPNYAVQADLVVKSGVENVALVGRQDVNDTNGDFYLFSYNLASSRWELYRAVDGALTSLGSSIQLLLPGQTYRMRLDLNGTAIRAFVNDTLAISVTDATYSAAGRAGVRLGASTSVYNVTNTTGFHLDDFSVVERLADSHGGNAGEYFNRPTTGVVGAIVNDGSTAVRFNGTTTYASIPDSASLDLGDGPVSIEAWVKRADNGTGTQTVLQKGTGAYQLAFKNNKIGLYRYGIAGAIAESSATQLDTGAFHHYVVTKSGAVTKIYVDGVDVTVAGTNQTLVNTATPLVLAGSAGEWLNGTLDEVAIYNQVLTPAQAADHFHRGSGS